MLDKPQKSAYNKFNSKPVIEKSTLCGSFQRAAGGGKAAAEAQGNGLMRAAESATASVVADGACPL